MESRKNVDGFAVGLIAIVSLIWGLQQVFVKAVADDMSPVLQIALRSGIALLLLASIMTWRNEQLISKETWKPGLLAGLLFALEFFLVGEGLRHTTASHMVVFLYTAPIFVALTLHFKIESEKLKPLQWAGIIMAFSGITLTFLWRDNQSIELEAANILWGDFLALLAAISWAATTVLVRSSSLSKAPASQTLLYQLFACFIFVLLAGIAMGQTEYKLTIAVVSNLAFQGIIVSFASLLLWFWLLRQYSASQLGVYTFMTPLFGILFGVLILSEPIEESFIFGATFVMMGIILVNGHEKIKNKLRLCFKS